MPLHEEGLVQRLSTRDFGEVTVCGRQWARATLVLQFKGGKADTNRRELSWGTSTHPSPPCPPSQTTSLEVSSPLQRPAAPPRIIGSPPSPAFYPFHSSSCAGIGHPVSMQLQPNDFSVRPMPATVKRIMMRLKCIRRRPCLQQFY